MHDCAGIVGLVAGMAKCCLNRELHWRDLRFVSFLLLLLPHAWQVARTQFLPDPVSPDASMSRCVDS